MFFYLSYLDSLHIYSENQAYDFVVELPETLDLSEGTWVCNLANCSQPQSGDRLILLDSLEYSYIGGTYKPILRRIDLDYEDFPTPQWVKVKSAFVKRFHVTVLDFKTLTPPSKNLAPLDILIELKKL